jgi:DNA-binding MarR family transcriptional regulator
MAAQAADTGVPATGGVVSSAQDRLDLELSQMVYDLVHRWDQLLESCAEDVGLTAPQALIIYQLEEPARMSTLAETLNCNASNITGIVDRLELQGLVARSPDPEDRRATRVRLTRSGNRKRAALQRRLYDREPPFGRLTLRDKRILRELLALAAAVDTTVSA